MLEKLGILWVKKVKIFLDTANLSEIHQALKAGILDGVTTNPSLLKAAVDERQKKGEKTDIIEYIKAILQVCENRPVSLEVLGGDVEELARQAVILWEKFKDYGNVVIKIPINPSLAYGDGLSYEGIKAIRHLANKGIPINATLIFTPIQALLARSAAFVSPFSGRIDDYLRKNSGIEFGKSDYFPAEGIEKNGKKIDDNGVVSGVDLVRRIVQIFGNYNVECEVIAASLRNARQVREVAEAGADVVTMPFDVMQQLLAHPKTLEGMKKFLGDAPEEYKRLFG